MNLREAIEGINSLHSNKCIHADAPFTPESQAYLRDWVKPRESILGTDLPENVSVVGNLEEIMKIHAFSIKLKGEAGAIKETVQHFEKCRKEKAWFAAITKTSDYYELEYGYRSEPISIDRLRMVGCTGPFLYEEVTGNWDDCDGEYGPCEVTVTEAEVTAWVEACAAGENPEPLDFTDHTDIIYCLYYVPGE